MHTASATEAPQCFADIISCTSIPLKVLSDRGSIFLSKLMKGFYEMLGIDSIATSSYRPQSNGVVERFHGTLKPMLAKAVDSGIDWAEFLPLALFAIRQVPNRNLGYSPHYLVYGRDVHGPLDVLYKGWVDREFDSMNVEEWLVKLNDRLSVIHDLAVNEESKNVEKRVLSFNKGKSDRSLEVGSKVLMRVPGIHAALQAAWEGPYNVIDKTFRVAYKVSRGNDHPVKLAHINNLKVCVDRPLSVNAVPAELTRRHTSHDFTKSTISEWTPGHVKRLPIALLMPLTPISAVLSCASSKTLRRLHAGTTILSTLSPSPFKIE